MRALVAAACLCACGNSTPTPPAQGSGSGSAPAPVAVVAVDAPPALPPKIKAARCGEPCLFLADTELGKLLDTYKAECGGMETKDLGFTDCKQLDYVRNCIYAAHGLVYKKKKWKTLFAQKPWYEPHPDLDAKTMLSAVELANVHELNSRGKACKKGLQISGADYDHVKKWFASLAKKKPDVPQLAYFAGGKVDGAGFAQLLNEALKAENISKLGDRTFATYVDKLDDTLAADEMPSDLVDALKAMKPMPRIIQIDFDSGTSGTEDDPISEGTMVWLAYDAQHKLVAVAAKHYLWD
jgi:hypothetical protein